jgi:hypothetical protein
MGDRPAVTERSLTWKFTPGMQPKLTLRSPGNMHNYIVCL